MIERLLLKFYVRYGVVVFFKRKGILTFLKILPDGVKMCRAETAAVNTVGVIKGFTTKMY